MSLYYGKTPARHDPKNLKLYDYLDFSALPSPPEQFGHEDKMPQPRLMLGNGPDDSVARGFQGAGDCFWAMACNAIRLADAIAGKGTVPITGREAIGAYSEFTGYVLGDASTDGGTNMNDGLNAWRQTGIADAAGVRHKLGAYLELDLDNLEQELDALYVLDIGVALGVVVSPDMMAEFAANEPWTATGTTQDGHAILWDAHRNFEFIESWARDQEATPAWVKAQADEAFALLLPEMLADGKSLEGLDLEQLQADLGQL